MLSELMAWLQYKLGADVMDGLIVSGTSWSEELRGSANLWTVLEGTHVLTLMLFAGTIMIVDLRLLGVAFRGTPVSKINDKLLPYTVTGFVIMIITGLILFYAKPLDYYHNIWFRLKMIFLIVAAINIFSFHHKVQKNIDEWDAAPVPPASARRAAIVSLTLWALIIIVGRFIAYDWFDCAKMGDGIGSFVAECAAKDAVLEKLSQEMQ